jgi:GDPmannose 4,6-dehydratase
LGVELEFSGSGAAEVGRVLRCSDSRFSLPSGKVVVAVDERYYRPSEVDLLVGDSTKIREKLGWVPEYSFERLLQEMVSEDLKRASMRLAGI